MNKREWMLHTISLVYGSGAPLRKDVDLPGFFSNMYDAIVAATTDEGWIEHRGEKPYPEGDVEVKLRDGNTFVNDADAFIWTHDTGFPSEDIIAWRPAR